LKYLIKNKLLLPEYLDQIDLDRLKEEEEEFLSIDNKKLLALEKYRLKPL
jgi:hypothetical protein